MAKDFFAGGVEKQIVCNNYTVPIPLRAPVVNSMYAIFPVATKKIAASIPSQLKPLSFMGQSCLIIGGIEYKEINIIPYNEVLVLAPVMFTGKMPPQGSALCPFERLGFHIMIISVTSEETLEAGREVWGYPKFMGDIKFTEQNGRRFCEWKADNEKILSFSISQSGIPVPFHGQIPDFSLRKGQICKNILKGKFMNHVSWGGSVEISFGPHKVGQQLADMIGSRRALSSSFAPNGMGTVDVPEWGVPA